VILDYCLIVQDFEKQSVDWTHTFNPISNTKFEAFVSIIVLFIWFTDHWRRFDCVGFHHSRDLAQNKLSGEIP